MKPRNFADDLAWSKSWSSAPWWEQVYREAFPAMVSMRLVNGDGWAQRGGIDRIVGLADGTNITVDEKVREEHWPDIALEVYDDLRRKTPGWANPSRFLTCDYIAYAMVPSATCYLLPYQLLRRVMSLQGNQWWDACKQDRTGFRFVDAANKYEGRSWTTRSIAVPTALVLNAIRDVLIVHWEGGGLATTS